MITMESNVSIIIIIIVIIINFLTINCYLILPTCTALQWTTVCWAGQQQHCDLLDEAALNQMMSMIIVSCASSAL